MTVVNVVMFVVGCPDVVSSVVDVELVNSLLVDMLVDIVDSVAVVVGRVVVKEVNVSVEASVTVTSVGPEV